MNYRQIMEDANSAVPRITPEEAKRLMTYGNTLVVDVREVHEVAKSGKIAGALNVPSGIVALRANPRTPDYDDNFAKDKTIILYCAAGERSALSGKVLKDMGYLHVYNLGGFDDWVDNGGPVDKMSTGTQSREER